MNEDGQEEDQGAQGDYPVFSPRRLRSRELQRMRLIYRQLSLIWTWLKNLESTSKV
jgi:hypothetical protein